MRGFRHKSYLLRTRRKRQVRYNEKFRPCQRRILSRLQTYTPESYSPPSVLPDRAPACVWRKHGWAGEMAHVYEYVSCLRYCKTWLSARLADLGFSGNAFDRDFDPVRQSHSTYELLANHRFCLEAHIKLARACTNKHDTAAGQVHKVGDEDNHPQGNGDPVRAPRGSTGKPVAASGER